MVSKGRIILSIVLIGFGIYAIVNFANGLNEVKIAEENLKLTEKNVGYEYGRCVFYDEISVELCNQMAGPDGLRFYEKYYADGSWRVEEDPIK